MNALQFVNDTISVEADLNNGQLRPKIVLWQEKRFTVTGVGRQWTENEATHLLVELHDGSRMEINMASNFTWRILRYWPPALAA